LYQSTQIKKQFNYAEKNKRNIKVKSSWVFTTSLDSWWLCFL